MQTGPEHWTTKPRTADQARELAGPDGELPVGDRIELFEWFDHFEVVQIDSPPGRPDEEITLVDSHGCGLAAATILDRDDGPAYALV